MPAPLTPPAFWILTALTAGRRHGYDILRETAEASGGRVMLKVTTLYSALERLERDGLIASDGEEIVSGRARRYYALTQSGHAALAAEVEALESQARVARARLAASRPASAPARAVLS
jgi:DNA-binding PadR family transcriptional regulator